MGILKNKYFNFFIKTIEIIIIIVILCYIGFIAFQRLSGNKSIGGYRLFTVSSGSMEGVYDINDVIIVKDIDYNDLEVGDDIVYQANDHDLKDFIISHRIIKIFVDDYGEKKFITKGVKNVVVDPEISGNQIYGKIIRKVPIITELNQIVSSKSGFFLLIFCPLLFIIVYEILKAIYGLNKDDETIKIKVNEDKLLDEKNSIEQPVIVPVDKEQENHE